MSVAVRLVPAFACATSYGCCGNFVVETTMLCLDSAARWRVLHPEEHRGRQRARVLRCGSYRVHVAGAQSRLHLASPGSCVLSSGQ